MLSRIHLRDWARAVFHELYKYRVKYTLIGVTLLLGILLLSVFYSERYVVSSVIRFDSKGASVDHLQQVLYAEKTRESLQQHFPQRYTLASEIAELFSHALEVSSQGETLAHIHFTHTDKDHALAMVQKLEALLTSNLDLARQLEVYEQDLTRLTEQKNALVLEKDAQAERIAYSQSGDLKTGVNSVDGRVARLEEQVQQTKIEIRVLNTRMDSLSSRLQVEEEKLEFASEYRLVEENFEFNQRALDQTRDEIAELQQEFDGLMERKRNREERQRIIQLEGSISAEEKILVGQQKEVELLKSQLTSLQTDPRFDADTDSVKRFYQELQQQLTLGEIEQKSLREKSAILKASLREQKGSLEEKQERFISVINVEQVIARVDRNIQDIESEITDVQHAMDTLNATKKPYSVYQNAVLPDHYYGIGIREILMLGPFLAICIPFLFAYLSVLLDSRIRTTSQLHNYLPDRVVVLEDIPHYNSPMGSRGMRHTMVIFFLWSFAIFCVYIGLSTMGLHV